jgi:hypothetical protein
MMILVSATGFVVISEMVTVEQQQDATKYLHTARLSIDGR